MSIGEKDIVQPHPTMFLIENLLEKDHVGFERRLIPLGVVSSTDCQEIVGGG